MVEMSLPCVPFNGSTERALKDLSETAAAPPRALVPFNGSTERALKGLGKTAPGEGIHVPFNGSTERALKAQYINTFIQSQTRSIQRLNRESTESSNWTA